MAKALSREESLAILEANPISLTVSDAAKIMGKSDMFIRCGLRATPPRFAFGSAVQMPGGEWSYFIATVLFRQMVGI